MERLGPVTVPALAGRLGMDPSRIEAALLALESRGSVLRGIFTPGAPPGSTEWCDRRLLTRIHRLTIGRLRREIEPVSAADFIRFLLRWQHLSPGTQLHGRRGIAEVIGQLQGLELPAPAWERDVLPARIARYDPADLEALCLSGEVAWARLGIEEEPPIRPPAPLRPATPAPAIGGAGGVPPPPVRLPCRSCYGRTWRSSSIRRRATSSRSPDSPRRRGKWPATWPGGAPRS